MFNKRSLILATLASASALTVQAVNACTEVLLNKSQGVVISGRTLDYDCEMGSKICFRPKGLSVSDPCVHFTKLTGEPLKWTSKYSAVLVDAFNEPAFVDAMNTEGLSIGTLWHADTQPAKDVEPGKHGLSNVSLVEYIVENAKTVEEAKKLVANLSLVISVYKGQPMTLHWIVTERSGKSAVIELKDGHAKFFDESTEVGVMSNAPSYDQQLANLKASQNLLSTDPKYTIPGDYQSTSRFVKSAFLISRLPELKTSEDGIAAATQILHNVESPKGAQGPKGSYTQWMVVRDQTNLRYMVMGVKHTNPKIVDLKNIDFNQLADKRIAVESSSSGDVAAMPEFTSAQATVSSSSQ